MTRCVINKVSEKESLRQNKKVFENTPKQHEKRGMYALKMSEKKSVAREFQVLYRKASKKQKGSILDRLIELTSYNRCYVARKLRGSTCKHRPGLKTPHGRGRKGKCSKWLLEPLLMIWKGFDYACAKRVHPGMEDMLSVILRFGELKCSEKDIELLEGMSASIIEKLLRAERKRMAIHGWFTTKPGTLLKSQIPVRLGDQWDDGNAGFVEINLAAHCGSSVRGDYLNTLDMIDIETC